MSKVLVFVFMVILILGFVTSAKADEKTLGPAKPNVKKNSAPTPVPEPVSIALLGGGLLGLYGLLKKKGDD